MHIDGSIYPTSPSLTPSLSLSLCLPLTLSLSLSLWSGVRIPPMIELGGWFSTGDDLEDMTKVSLSVALTHCACFTGEISCKLLSAHSYRLTCVLNAVGG